MKRIIQFCLGWILLGVAATPHAADASRTAPPCTSRTSECIQTIANLYLDALRRHDGSRLPLARDVRRTENALTNARGPDEVRESFARTTMVEDIRDARFFSMPATSRRCCFSWSTSI